MEGFAKTSRPYRDKGWMVLPLPAKKKASPPGGYHGNGRDPTEVDYQTWSSRRGNLALLPPDGVVGLDVDAYGGKHGDETLAKLEAECGELPATWRSSSRADDPVSGIRWYRVPNGYRWEDVGGDIETIRRNDRYAVVYPSVHPDTGQVYRWYRPDGSVTDDVPGVDDLPTLPELWQQRIRKDVGTYKTARPITDDERRRARTAGEPDEEITAVVEFARQSLIAPQQARYEIAKEFTWQLVRLGLDEHPGVDQALDDLYTAYEQAVAGERDTDAEYQRLVDGAIAKQLPEPDTEEEMTCAMALMKTKMDPLRWTVRGLIPEGLGIFSAPPKVGKSVLALQLCVAVATGMSIFDMDTERGDVLYLALEDGPRRLQKRLRDTEHSNLLSSAAAFDIATRWPRADVGGLAKIEQWLDGHPNARLVVIDVYQAFRAASDGSGRRNLYSEDYRAMQPLRKLAQDHHVAILLVHHNRKGVGRGGDWVESPSGSTGMTGAPDYLMLVYRERGAPNGQLLVTGREVSDKILALAFETDPDKPARWSLGGTDLDFFEDALPDPTLAWLREQTEPVTPQQVADHRGVTARAAQNWLNDHRASGEVELVEPARGPGRPALWAATAPVPV